MDAVVWQLMLLLVIGEAPQVRMVVSEHPTRSQCAFAAHNHRMKALASDGPNTVRVYWCKAEEKPK